MITTRVALLYPPVLLEAYRRLFPEFNKVRVARQGGWMAFKPISKVEGWRDFGFAFKEGDGEPEWDDAHDLITFHYTEPTTWWMRMKERGGGLATMSECLALAEKLASGGNPAKRGYAKAWKKCAIKDVDGNPCGKIKGKFVRVVPPQVLPCRSSAGIGAASVPDNSVLSFQD